MSGRRRKRSLLGSISHSKDGSAGPAGRTAQRGLDPKTRRTALPISVDEIPPLLSLPHDLWFEIWRRLSPHERRNAMLVCKRWRRIGLSDARMWAKPYLFTAIHGKPCCCTSCTRRKRQGRSKELPNPTGWRDIPDALRDQSNVTSAPDLLSRSASLPLELTVDIMPFWPDFDEINLLAEAILPHAPRIAVLSIRSCTTSTYEYLVEQLALFPSLHTFSAGLLENADGVYKPIDFACPSLQLPKLRTLRLDKGYRWTQASAISAELRSLSITPCEDASQELVSALSACPRLTALRVDLQAYAYDGETWHPPAKNARNLFATLPSLQSVEIAGLERDSERWALTSLAPSSMRSICLEYASPGDLKDGWRRFGDLRGSAHMRLGHESSWRDLPCATDKVFAIEIVDETGRSRRLALHGCSMETALDAVCCLSRILDKDVRLTVTTDNSLWPLVACAFEDCGRVRAAELILYAPGTRGCGRHGRYSYSLPGTIFTADEISIPVSEVTLVHGSPDAALTLGPYEIEVRMRKTGIVLPVDTLTIDRRLSGRHSIADADLSAVARSVVLTDCDVPELALPAPLRPEPEDGSSYDPNDSD